MPLQNESKHNDNWIKGRRRPSKNINMLIRLYLYPFLLYSTLTVWKGYFSFWIYTQSVGLLGRVIGPSQGRYLNTGQHKHTHQTSMPRVGFEPTITASERAETVHALDGSANVTGYLIFNDL
jgi:hypothetical protein